ncbi:hypothetical protein BASA83_010830 [Batrachochytrium salamandrivorans]|nr:hypothetical protein BASA83_010830 [Batrachochytrium salamandrivorans]
MRKRNGFDENTSDYYFKVGDMVKMKHHDRQKLEFNWKGPYHVVDVGHPGTYWIMTPQGLRLPNAVNQADLAPWLAPVIDNVDFFYDGTIETHLWIRKGLVLSCLLWSSGPLYSRLSSAAILGCSSTIPLGQQLPSVINIKHDPEPPEHPNLEELSPPSPTDLGHWKLKTKPSNKNSPRKISVRYRQKKIATLGTLLTDKALSWYNPYIEQPERYAYDLSSWSTFKARMKATFGEINQEQVSETKIGHSDKFYSGLSSEIKDHLVHCESPYRWLLLWTKQFGSTTGFLNGDKNNSTILVHSDATNL